VWGRGGYLIIFEIGIVFATAFFPSSSSRLAHISSLLSNLYLNVSFGVGVRKLEKFHGSDEIQFA